MWPSWFAMNCGSVGCHCQSAGALPRTRTSSYSGCDASHTRVANSDANWISQLIVAICSCPARRRMTLCRRVMCWAKYPSILPSRLSIGEQFILVPNSVNFLARKSTPSMYRHTTRVRTRSFSLGIGGPSISSTHDRSFLCNLHCRISLSRRLASGLLWNLGRPCCGKRSDPTRARYSVRHLGNCSFAASQKGPTESS